MNGGYRIHINLEYMNRDILIKEFERICIEMKKNNYRYVQCSSGRNTYSILGPIIPQFTPDEIIKLRKYLEEHP